MEILIAFLLTLGSLFSDADIQNFEIDHMSVEMEQALIDEFGDNYITIIVTDENEY